MAGLSHLRDIYEKRGKDFLESLLNKTVIINENSKGSYFGAKKNSGKNSFSFFKKDSKIGYADRVLNKYYESGISYFENVDGNSIKDIPENYVFGMEYDPSKKIPLTLTHIKVLDESFQQKSIIQDKERLAKWAQTLKLNEPNIIFQGKLNEDQKSKILEFIYTPLSDLSEKFKTTSFTKHILSILGKTNENEDFPISEIVFRFYEDDDTGESTVLAKLVDPVFYDHSKSVKPSTSRKKSDDYIWIIVIDLMNFIEKYRLSELRRFTISGVNDEERYVSLINHLFSAFIHEYGEKYKDLEIRIPEFLSKSEFDVNLDLVKDHRVVEIINSNPNFKEIYRIFINVFRKKKTTLPSQWFTDSMKANLSAQIDKLDKIAQGDKIYENYFPTFNEFVGTEEEPGYFETFDRSEDDPGKVKRVNLLISEFQPLNLGHLKTAKALYEKNGLPTLLVGIHPGKTSKKFPFKNETVKNSISKLVNSDHSVFAGYVMLENSNIESILKAIKPGFEPVMIASTPSRVRDLALQLELAKKRSRNLNIKNDTVLVEVSDYQIENEIMDSIKNKDFSKFKQLVPDCSHSDFYNLEKDMESVNEKTKMVTESKNIEIELEIEPLIEYESEKIS